MIGKKIAGAGCFAALFAFVCTVGSAIFGQITPHVGDYQFLRLIIYCSVTVVLGWCLFTFSRCRNLLLRYEYLQSSKKGMRFFLSHRGFRTELAVVLVLLVLIALFLALSDKQLTHTVGNTTLAAYLLLGGYPVYVLGDLLSWRVVALIYQKK